MGKQSLDLVPTDDTNIAWRAARLVAERAGVDPDVHLHLRKGVPVAGGMAGGSADGAAALVACDALWGTGLSRAERGHGEVGCGRSPGWGQDGEWLVQLCGLPSARRLELM